MGMSRVKKFSELNKQACLLIRDLRVSSCIRGRRNIENPERLGLLQSVEICGMRNHGIIPSSAGWIRRVLKSQTYLKERNNSKLVFVEKCKNK